MISSTYGPPHSAPRIAAGRRPPRSVPPTAPRRYRRAASAASPRPPAGVSREIGEGSRHGEETRIIGDHVFHCLSGIHLQRASFPQQDQPERMINSASESSTPSMGTWRLPRWRVAIELLHLSRTSADALSRNQWVPSALMVTDDCERGRAERGSERQPTRGTPAIPLRNPRPAAVPSRMTCTWKSARARFREPSR